MAIDGRTPYVAYTDFGNSYKATVMQYSGSTWETVGSAGFSEGEALDISIAIDKTGAPYISYSDTVNSRKATVMKYGFAAEVKSVSSPFFATFSPNPNRGSFTFHLSSPLKENATIIITNTLGEKVEELSATTNSDTEVQLNVPPGVYFVSAVTKGGSVNEKIIIE